MNTFFVLLAIIPLAFAAGCAIRPAPRGAAVQVGYPSAAVRVVTRPAKPGSSHIWRSGHYVWKSGRYGWVAGAWVLPPTGRQVWVPGRWKNGRTGGFWVPGHWS